MRREQRRLVLVSNRGPVTFEADGSVARGGGGLVTALSGLASYREVIWIASAMNEHDAEVSRGHSGQAFPVHSPGGGEYQVRLVVSDPDAYDRFYNIFANPMLWFIQHYLWDLSNAPDIRREEIEAFEFGYNVVNEDLARAVVDELGGSHEPVVMVHDYHLYTLPELVRRARPDVFGARLTGGGFGGCTVNLVAREHSETFASALKLAYLQRYNITAETYLCDAVDGAYTRSPLST